MKFAVMMLIGAVSASSQIVAPESNQSLWSVSMDNAKYKEIVAEDKKIQQKWEKFYHDHPRVQAEAKKLVKIFHKKMAKLSVRLEKTGKLLDNAKYQKELNEIADKMKALDLKIKKALRWDAQGLKMWKLSMNNKKYKEIAADDKEIQKDVEDFIHSHPKVGKELQDLTHDIQAEFHQIGQRLEKTGGLLSDPKYKAELQAIDKRWKALEAKFKRNLHWDDEGLKMWKVSMDPKVDQEIEQGKAEVWKDMQNLKYPYRRLAYQFQKYEHDQEINRMQIGQRFEEAYHKLDTPKHRMQLKQIETRWNKLQAYTDKEEQAIFMQFQAFLKQPEVQAELRDLDMDVSKELRDMDLRWKQFEMEVDQKISPDFSRRLHAIGAKLEALDYKFKKNLKFDPETKMWKLSMDNKVDQELKKDQAEIEKDVDAFVNGHPEVQKELQELGQDLQKEFHDVQTEIMESAKLLEDPKYKAELEAIAAKMKALDAKFKANVKWEA